MPAARSSKPHLAHRGSEPQKKNSEKFFLPVSALLAPRPCQNPACSSSAAHGSPLPVEPVLHHIRAVQGSAVHHGCTVQAVLSSALLFFRLAPTPPRKGPSPARTGSFGGGSPPTAPPMAPLYIGELKLPPCMGGVETPPISLITPFFCDINPV